MSVRFPPPQLSTTQASNTQTAQTQALPNVADTNNESDVKPQGNNAPEQAFTQGGNINATDVSHAPNNRPAGGLDALSVRFTPFSTHGFNPEILLEITDLVSGWTNRKDETVILQKLGDANPEALNTALLNVDLHELVNSMDDHFMGPANRTALFDLLGRSRIADLRINTRAALIHAVQEKRTGPAKEGFIRDLMVGTKGEDLSALKNAIDMTGDHHDLLQLVFHDIDDAGIRSQIQSHIEKEAKGVRKSHPKVLSDIDDTLYANLKDKRFEKKTRYPGVLSFYAQLSGGKIDKDRPEAMVTFLTARPEDRPGVVEDYTRDSLEELGVQNASVLSGSITHLIGNERIAEKKKENFNRFSALYPEYSTVFIGDSGQGDKHLTEPDATFIQNVNNMPASEQEALRKNGVFVFETYAGAALEAFDLGLLDMDGLTTVATSARDEMVALPFADASQRKARLAELDKDLTAVNARLASPIALSS